ncbi:MAG: L,D-transpeptidase family protein [Faecalibacterium sp.]|jgi:hypothetical protein|nr:L,D-transpeptidase family protein [Faecalibacterium sp.]
MQNEPYGEKPHHNPSPSARRQVHYKRRRCRRARRMLAWGIVAVLAAALIFLAPKLLARGPSAGDASESTAQSAASSPAPESSAPASQSEAQSMAASSAPENNFTCTWDTTGQDSFDYLLAVNRVGNCVTVFTKDDAGNYTVPYKAMISSSGDATPVGSYHTIENYRWRLLEGNVYGQYATRITGHILFHSVPYFTQSVSDLEYDEFNKLGTAASLGCIRLQVADAKWIYDNCPIGTPTVLYDDAACPGPLGQPDFVHIDPADETLRGWDPTDPDPANPWATAAG